MNTGLGSSTQSQVTLQGVRRNVHYHPRRLIYKSTKSSEWKIYYQYITYCLNVQKTVYNELCINEIKLEENNNLKILERENIFFCI
jgi:hypothetical protein